VTLLPVLHGLLILILALVDETIAISKGKLYFVFPFS
jgi:hypothetical protein